MRNRAIDQDKKNRAKQTSQAVKASNEVVRRKWEAPSSASSRGRPNDDQYMNPFETHTDSFIAQKIEQAPKQRKQWDKNKNVFDYGDEEEDFMEDFGFKKDVDAEESISKFSSHANFEPPLIPTKSELVRTDSNAITEVANDFTSNADLEFQTDNQDKNSNDMEDLLYHASNADIEFMKQSLTNIQEMMMREIEEMNQTASKKMKDQKQKIVEDENEYDDDFEDIDEEIAVPKDDEDDNDSDQDSIEEDLNVDVNEDSGSDDIEDQMDKFRTQKQKKDTKSMKPPVHDSNKKRAISAKYQLKSQHQTQKTGKKADSKTNKSTVLAALKEENEKINTDEPEQRLKADTNKSRPFSNIGTRDQQKVISRTKKSQNKNNIFDVDFKIGKLLYFFLLIVHHYHLYIFVF